MSTDNQPLTLLDGWIAKLQSQAAALMELLDHALDGTLYADDDEKKPPTIDPIQAAQVAAKYLALAAKLVDQRQLYLEHSDDNERLLLETIIGSGVSVIEARPYGDEDFDEVERQVLGRITERKSSS